MPAGKMEGQLCVQRCLSGPITRASSWIHFLFIRPSSHTEHSAFSFLFFQLQISTMSHPSWLPPRSTGEPLGHVPARMETTHSFGTPSISVSTQQPPKKFAPVVAPKPKYNPYKQPGGEGEFWWPEWEISLQYDLLSELYWQEVSCYVYHNLWSVQF